MKTTSPLRNSIICVKNICFIFWKFLAHQLSSFHPNQRASPTSPFALPLPSSLRLFCRAQFGVSGSASRRRCRRGTPSSDETGKSTRAQTRDAAVNAVGVRSEHAQRDVHRPPIRFPPNTLAVLPLGPFQKFSHSEKLNALLGFERLCRKFDKIGAGSRRLLPKTQVTSGTSSLKTARHLSPRATRPAPNDQRTIASRKGKTKSFEGLMFQPGV